MARTFPGCCKACWGSALGNRMTRQATLLPKRIKKHLSDCHLHSSFASWQTMLIASHSLSCREATVYNSVWLFAWLSVIVMLGGVPPYCFFSCLAGIWNYLQNSLQSALKPCIILIFSAGRCGFDGSTLYRGYCGVFGFRVTDSTGCCQINVNNKHSSHESHQNPHNSRKPAYFEGLQNYRFRAIFLRDYFERCFLGKQQQQR